MGIFKNIPVLIVRILTTLCLVYALFTSGLYVCTTPQATSTIGHTFSNWNHTIFPEEDMATIAEATRAFSVEGGEESVLNTVVMEVLKRNYPEAYEGITSAATGYTTIVDRYTLTPDAISHLQDCTPVFQTVQISTGVIGAFGIAGLIAMFIMAGRKRAGGTLLSAALITICIIVGLGLWAVLDFQSLFTLMHSAFFAEGTWLFDYRSLLIQLFPEEFWAAMAFLWGICSILISIVAGVLGRIIKL